jgi:hypothetical protein
MSTTNPNTAEPTESEPGGSTSTTDSDSSQTAAPAEPTESEPGS